MKYLLDTNLIIHFFHDKFNINEKIHQVGLAHCAISEVTLAELVYGAENSMNRDKQMSAVQDISNQINVLPLLEAIPFYGKEKARLRKSGLMISDFDLMIGTTALAHGLIMATENTKEFRRIKNLKIENWIQR